MPNLSATELLELTRWNTPAVLNGWEQIAKDPMRLDVFNREVCTDYMPGMMPMVGHAVTLVIQPSDPSHRETNPNAWSEYRRYVGSIPGRKVVVVQDLDSPNNVGAFWGEVNSSFHREMGCVGTIIDGAVRDLDEMLTVGFKALARRTCVHHAFSTPVRWGGEVEVFGCKVSPGQLIHADKHGFFACPPEDQDALLEATRFMDNAECSTMLSCSRDRTWSSREEMLDQFDESCQQFGDRVSQKYGSEGEFS